jgi:hypothetical protein
MKRIGVEINGVLRDTIEKFKQTYQKHLIDNYQDEFVGQTFKIDLSGNTEENEIQEPFKIKKSYILLSMKNILWNYSDTHHQQK